VLTFYAPQAYKPVSAKINGDKVEIRQNGRIFKIAYTAKKTATVKWSIKFKKG
jgi:hypothetical protein